MTFLVVTHLWWSISIGLALLCLVTCFAEWWDGE